MFERKHVVITFAAAIVSGKRTLGFQARVLSGYFPVSPSCLDKQFELMGPRTVMAANMLPLKKAVTNVITHKHRQWSKTANKHHKILVLAVKRRVTLVYRPYSN